MRLNGTTLSLCGKRAPNNLTEQVIFMQVRNSFLMFNSEFGRRGGLMVRVLDSGSSGPGSVPGRGHCVVFLGKTLYSHGASLHPGV